MEDDTEVNYSCSATLNGELFVFGGKTHQKQVKHIDLNCIYNYKLLKVSKVIGCGLQRIGDLSYDFYVGTCATYNFPAERILLCFAEAYTQKCERLNLSTLQ